MILLLGLKFESSYITQPTVPHPQIYDIAPTHEYASINSPIHSLLCSYIEHEAHRTQYHNLFQENKPFPNSDDGIPNSHPNRLQPNSPRRSLRQPKQLLRNDNRERLHPNRVRGANRPSGILRAVGPRGQNLAAPGFSAHPAR